MSKYTIDNQFIKDARMGDFLDLTVQGDPRKALTNTLFGYNHRGADAPASTESSGVGLVFFTRPQLNLSIFNLQRSRHLMNLANTDPNSVQRYIRCMLDPRVANAGVEIAYGKDKSTGKLKCPRIQLSPLIDQYQIFIPLLTNTCKSISGFPDPVVPTYTSKENVRGGQWSIVDGIMDINNAYDISCTFDNVKNAPVRMLLTYWIRYQTLVFDGVITPYYDYLAANEIDYNTRIYRIILDEHKRYVKHIGATGASFPTSIDTGRLFNYNKGNPLLEGNNEISVTFKSIGASYDDSILVDEFNKAVCIACPPMKVIRAYRIIGEEIKENDPNLELIKVPYDFLQYFNYRGYPFIDYQTYELCWYVIKQSKRYESVMKYISKE